jgi:prepilin-type N-terminal cleavage/methylation domain-containing protein
MPISQTGRSESGYTLLEILAVIMLLGLVLAWVTPNLLDGEERTALQYIQRLLESDLRQMKEAAVRERMEIMIGFDGHGYRMQLPDTIIDRNFAHYGFSFLPPPPAEDDPHGEKQAFPKLKIKPDGTCDGMTVQWNSTHYSGGLSVDANGAIHFSSGPKIKD